MYARILCGLGCLRSYVTVVDVAAERGTRKLQEEWRYLPVSIATCGGGSAYNSCTTTLPSEKLPDFTACSKEDYKSTHFFLCKENQLHTSNLVNQEEKTT